MKINELNLQQNIKQVSVNDFKRPMTLGNPPKEVNKALDDAFRPIKSLLQHSLGGLLSAGYNAFVGYGVLLQLCQNSLIRAAVESKASDMTNRWGKFTIEGDNNDPKLAERCDTLNKQAKKFNIQKLFRKGACGAGYFGGTYVFIDILGDEQEDWANPLILSKETIPVGTLRGFKIIDPYLVTPTNYNSINPMADDYYQPQVFYVQGIPVHTSRLLYFGEGEPLPFMLRPGYNFTNISLAQKMLDAVAHYTSCRENAQALLERYALTVFKTDMGTVLTGGADQEMRNRIKMFIQNRNNFGVATIDKEQEELITQTTSLAGLTDIMQRAMEFVAAMADEPVTRMWGLSPSGFSTGDADIKNHYDKIEAKQEMMFRKNIDIVTQLLQYNYFGDVDKEIVFTFAPLTEENESVKIANNIQKAQYDATLLQNGIIQQEDVRKRLLDDPDSGYNSLEELQDMPPDMQPFIEGEEEEQEIAQDEEQKWITVNGTHIPINKNGELQGKVGKKINNKIIPKKASPDTISKIKKFYEDFDVWGELKKARQEVRNKYNEVNDSDYYTYDKEEDIIVPNPKYRKEINEIVRFKSQQQINKILKEDGAYLESGYYISTRNPKEALLLSDFSLEKGGYFLRGINSKNKDDNISAESFGELKKIDKKTAKDILAREAKRLHSQETFGGLSNNDEELLKLHAYASVFSSNLRKGINGKNEQELKNIIDRTWSPARTVFRGVAGEFADKLKNMSVGESFIDKGFASTSMEKDIAKQFTGNNTGVIIQIEVPEGYGKSFSMSSYSPKNEYEILLNADTKFRITKKENGIIYCKVEGEEDIAEDDIIDKNGAHHGEHNGQFVKSGGDFNPKKILTQIL